MLLCIIAIIFIPSICAKHFLVLDGTNEAAGRDTSRSRNGTFGGATVSGLVSSTSRSRNGTNGGGAGRGQLSMNSASRSRNGTNRGTAGRGPVSTNYTSQPHNGTNRGAVDRRPVLNQPRSSQWAPNFNPPPEECRPRITITLFGNGSCACTACGISFIDDDIVISDLDHSRCVDPIHLHCWDATQSNGSFIQQALKKRTQSTRMTYLSMQLRSTHLPISGWDALNCTRRLLFVQRVFASKDKHNINAKHIFGYFPCGDCPCCETPQWCSFQSCCAPDMKPSKCSKCPKDVHRQCQTNYETAKRTTETDTFCIECHPITLTSQHQTRSRTAGTTRTFAPRCQRSFGGSQSIIYSSEPSEFNTSIVHFIVLLE